MLEVILKKEIEALGDKGAVVRVANGYARNYLFPQGIAMPATPGNLKQVETMKAAAVREAAEKHSDAATQKELLDGKEVMISAKAGDTDQLFGSVNTRDIAAAVSELGVDVDRRRVVLDKAIRMVGDYDTVIRLYRDVSATVTVKVRAEGREDEEPGQRQREMEEAEAEARAEAAAEYEAAQARRAEREAAKAAAEGGDAAEDGGDAEASGEAGGEADAESTTESGEAEEAEV